jgi:anti-sigma-K factor RskA
VNTQEYISSGIIEAYVLGIASAEERADVEKNMRQHSEIRKAVNEFEMQLEKKALQNAVPVPSSVRKNIFDSIDFTEPVRTEKPKVVSIQKRSSAGWKFLAAASVILFVVSAALNVYFYSSYKNAQISYKNLLAEQSNLQARVDVMQTKLSIFDSSVQMMKDPAMAVIKMPGVQGKETNMATVYWNTTNKDVYVLQNTMPKAPQGMQYQLWAIVDGKPVDAGMIGECEALCKMKNIPRAEAFAVTLEKAGGSPSPNLSALYVMGKV